MNTTSVLLFLNISIFVLTDLLADTFPEALMIKEQGVSKGFAVWGGEIWRLMTAMFLHANLGHIALNMYGLYYLGDAVESAIGTGRFIVVYFFTGVFGFIVSLVFLHPLSPTLGASGAIFGLIGALIGNEMRLGQHPLEFLDRNYGRNLMTFVLLNLVLGLIFPGINNAAHIGGLLMGIALPQVGLLNRVRSSNRVGKMLQAATVLLFIEATLYSFFPVFNGYWQYQKASNSAQRSQFKEARSALIRAIQLEPELALDPRVTKFSQYLGI